MSQSTISFTSAKSILSQFDLCDRETRLVAADALEEAGHTEAARSMRIAARQTTSEGEQVVTVSRRGSDCAATGRGFSRPIYCTAVYQAIRRQSDGVLTWRLVRRVGRGTAGAAISCPMVKAARAYATQHGLTYQAGIRHGKVCK